MSAVYDVVSSSDDVRQVRGGGASRCTEKSRTIDRRRRATAGNAPLKYRYLLEDYNFTSEQTH